MKPIKVEDQRIKALAMESKEAQFAMHYWTSIYRTRRNRLFKKIREKYPELEDALFVYDYEAHMLKSISVIDEEAE